MNKFVLIYKPKNQYINLGHMGVDKLNIGLNPRIYFSKESAEKAKSVDLPIALNRQLEICNNALYGLQDHGKPSWYEERHTKKLTKKQQEKLDWYENALNQNKKMRNFTESFNLDDVEIVEYSE
jgi:hypothetical protein